MKTLQADLPSYAGLLPYGTFDPDGSAFFNVDGSLGVVWSVKQLSVECASQEDLGALASRLASTLRVLPENSVCQIIVLINRDAEPKVTAWREATTGGQVFDDLALSRSRAVIEIDIPEPNADFVARRIECYLTLRLPPEPRSKARFLDLFDQDRVNREAKQEYAQAKGRLLEAAGLLETSALQVGLSPNRLGHVELARLLYRILNPMRFRYTREPAILQRSDLSLQRRVCASSLAFDVERGELAMDGQCHAMISVSELPTSTETRMISDLQRLLSQGMIVFNLHLLPQAELKRFLEKKKKLAFCQIAGGESTAGVEVLKAQIDEALADIEAQGMKVVAARLHVVAAEPNREELAARMNRLLGFFAQRGFGAVKEGALAATLFLQSLPLGYDPSNDRMLKRGRRMEDVNLAHLMPVYGRCEGTKTPDLLLVNRDGQPLYFSFFDVDEAPHGLITGISGSGKSVLANNIILCALRQKAPVFVLDIGGSYRKICEVLGGTYIDFGENICINPCGATIDEERQTFLTELVAEMVTAGKRDASQQERSIVSAAIRDAFEAKSGEEVFIRDIHRTLSARAEPEARQAALALELFCNKGNYARLFDGPCTVDFTKNLVVFELGRVAAREEISSVALLAIIQRITDYCARERHRRKYVIIDEAWTLLDSEATSNFIRAVYKTYRKLATCAIAISQQIDDFSGRAGQAVKDNAPNKMFLRQNPDAIGRIQELLGLSKSERDVLASLETRKGVFSEILILSPRTRGVARLTQDPYSYWMTTTDSEDNEYLRGLVEKFRSRGERDPLRAALLRASLDRPQGARGR